MRRVLLVSRHFLILGGTDLLFSFQTLQTHESLTGLHRANHDTILTLFYGTLIRECLT